MGQNSSLSWLFLVVAISECVCVDCSPPGSSVRGILRQEYWSGLPFPPAGDLPTQGMNQCLLPLLYLYSSSGSGSKISPQNSFDNVISMGEKILNVQCSSWYGRCCICHPSTDGLVSHSHTHLLYTYYLFCSLTPCQRLCNH